MRALSMWQPWATFVAEGLKMIETRSWKAPEKLWGERIGIQAAMHIPSYREVLSYPPGLRKLLCDLFGIPEPKYPDILREGVGAMPRGQLIATTRLVWCGQVHAGMGTQPDRLLHPPTQTWRMLPRQPELSLGDYTPGRWCWLFEDTRKLALPIPCRGYQGLWNIPTDIGERIPLIHHLNIDPLEEGATT